MDDKRLAKAGRRIAGSVKEAIGKITGDRKTEAAGSAQKAPGAQRKAEDDGKAARRDAGPR